MSSLGSETRTVVEGISFGEGPRWHESALWFSDVHGGAIHRVDDGRDSIVAESQDQPSGLGWLPDGTLIVTTMKADRVLRVGPGGALTVHADLSGRVRGVLNDMIVRSDGTAYVGDMGARVFDDEPDFSVRGKLFAISPSGEVTVAWEDLQAPNGMILTDDEKTLILAESSGLRLLAFDVQPDGRLDGVRTFAELRSPDPSAPLIAPDGICLDSEGAVWVGDPLGGRVVRVRPGGEVTDEHRFDGLTPVACVLGGPGRQTLFVCASTGWAHRDVANARNGRILAVDVAVPGAGKP